MCQASVRAVPMLSQVGIKRVWAGLRPGTPDELPILGSVDEVSGYYNATGGFRTGIVAAPLTARVVAQCVTGEATEVDISPFLASRFSATAGSQTPTAAAATL
jgi:hydrogen cyanide synthase HcnC